MSKIVYIDQVWYDNLKRYCRHESKRFNDLQKGIIVGDSEGNWYALARSYYPNTTLFKRLYPKGKEVGMFWVVIKVKL